MNVAGKQVHSCMENNFTEYDDQHDKVLLQPILHIIQTAPLDIWEEFANSFDYWLKVPEAAFTTVTTNYRKFYYANLLLEDLQENSASSASNKSSCSEIYGLPLTLNAIIQTYLLGGCDLTRIHPEKATILHIEQIEQICIARCMEQAWKENITFPTESEYYDMIVKETFGHFGSRIQFLQMHSSNQNDFRKLTTILGLFLRILKDFNYFISSNEDERQLHRPDEILNTLNLPLIHAVKSKTVEGEKILHIFRQRSNIKEVKGYVVSLLTEIGSLEYTQKILMKLKEEALDEITKFGKNPLLEDIVNKYIVIPIPINTVKASVNFSNESTETIENYLNHMQNVESDEKMKETLSKPQKHLNGADHRTYKMFFYSMLNKYMKLPEDIFNVLVNFTFTLCDAIIMLDDIEDRSILRNSVPCSYLIYGTINTVNSILYTFSTCLKMLLKLHQPSQAVNFYFKHSLEQLKGLGLDVYWRDNYICPTEDEFELLAVSKTACFIRLMLDLMNMSTTSCNINPEKLSGIIALFIEIYEDYENLVGKKYYDLKGFCEDISEGKCGFPTVHAVNTYPTEGKILMDILRQRTYDVEVKKTYLALLEKCGSLEYTRRKLMKIKEQIVNQLEQLASKDQVEMMLKQFTITSTKK